MIRHMYKTILFSLLVCNIKVAAQGCAEGEPKIGDTQPDLNITILPSTRIPVGTNITIICDADKPRLLNSGNTSLTPLSPVLITIFVGDNIVKSCKDVPSLTCRYIVPNVKETIPRRIYCRATNSENGCRLKFIELEFINATAVTTSRPTRNRTTTNKVSTPRPTKDQGGKGFTAIIIVICGTASVFTVAFVGFLYWMFARW